MCFRKLWVLSEKNQAFTAPSSEALHSCSTFEVPKNNKTLSVKYLMQLPKVKSWFENESWNRHLNSIMISDPCHTLLRMLCCHKKETFMSGVGSCQTLCCFGNRGFCFWKTSSVLFCEGKQSFDTFYERGLQLNEMFLESKIGVILFVVCLKNSNNNIQIVRITIANGESYENWRWFLDNLK